MSEPDPRELGRSMRTVIAMLGFAVDDIERGLWTEQDRRPLADVLEKLAAQLRGEPATPQIEGQIVRSNSLPPVAPRQ